MLSQRIFYFGPTNPLVPLLVLSYQDLTVFNFWFLNIFLLNVVFAATSHDISTIWLFIRLLVPYSNQIHCKIMRLRLLCMERPGETCVSMSAMYFYQGLRKATINFLLFVNFEKPRYSIQFFALNILMEWFLKLWN